MCSALPNSLNFLVNCYKLTLATDAVWSIFKCLLAAQAKNLDIVGLSKGCDMTWRMKSPEWNIALWSHIEIEMMIVQNLSLAGRCEKGIQSLLCTFHWTLIPLPNSLRILCSHLRDYENKFWTIRSKMLPYSPHNTSSFWISNHFRVTLVTDFRWLLYSFIMS